MKSELQSLSERERAALRLLGSGHDTKSIATALGLSVHTVNERLRGARRKLGVSSSREAARLLLAQERAGTAPQFVGAKEIGVAPGQATGPDALPSGGLATSEKRWPIYSLIGAVMILALVSIVASMAANETPGRTGGPQPARAMQSLPSLFTASDYPAGALEQGAKGATEVRLRISDSGRVQNCEIGRSSGNAALDAATCRVIRSRGRFQPAFDGVGRPIASDFTGKIEWMIK